MKPTVALLLSDGRWNYTWDAENRLKQGENLANRPQASKRKVVWDERVAGWLPAGMNAVGLRGEALASLGKGWPEKVALAWWLRQRTTARLAWIAAKLGMGHASRVSQAVARMRRRPGRRLQQLQRRLNNRDINSLTA